MEDFARGHLAPFPHADVVEVVVVLVDWAGGSEGVGAVVLVVGHWLLLGQLAPYHVVACNADIDDGLAFLDKIFAEEVASIRNNAVSVSYKIAIGVLAS